MALEATTDNKPLCLYHFPCADGFAAAWSVWKRHPGWEFRGVKHGEPPPDVNGRDVLLLDFSYRRAVMETLLQRACSITVLDHHKSVADELEPLLAAGRIHGIFDMKRSGARIAWEHFHPDTPPPQLLLHVEDMDLWRFDYPQTREINAALFAREYDFEVWDALMGRQALDELAREGAPIRCRMLKDIRELLQTSGKRMVIGGHNVPVLNAPYQWFSEAGHLMAEREAFAACYLDTALGRQFSLRSARHGKDVSAVAGFYGGGGHRHAAGFRAPVGWEGESFER